MKDIKNEKRKLKEQYLVAIQGPVAAIRKQLGIYRDNLRDIEMLPEQALEMYKCLNQNYEEMLLLGEKQNSLKEFEKYSTDTQKKARDLLGMLENPDVRVALEATGGLKTKVYKASQVLAKTFGGTSHIDRVISYITSGETNGQQECILVTSAKDDSEGTFIKPFMDYILKMTGLEELYSTSPVMATRADKNGSVQGISSLDKIIFELGDFGNSKSGFIYLNLHNNESERLKQGLKSKLINPETQSDFLRENDLVHDVRDISYNVAKYFIENDFNAKPSRTYEITAGTDQSDFKQNLIAELEEMPRDEKFDIHKASELLGIKPVTINARIVKGDLRSDQEGFHKKHLFNPQYLLDFVKKRDVTSKGIWRVRK